MKKLLLLPAFCFSVLWAAAQKDDQALALQLVSKNHAQIGLSEADLKNIIVSSSYFDKTSGAQLVYLQQSYLDIPVYNQIQVLAFKNNQALSNAGGRIRGIEKLVNGNKGIPSVSPTDAVYAALADRNLTAKRAPLVLESMLNGHKVTFDNMDISRENITATLMWVPVENGKKVVLAWEIYIIPLTSSDYWMVRVNAMDKSIIGVNNLTVYCNWDDPASKTTAASNQTANKSEANHQSVYGDKIFDFAQVKGTQQIQSSPSLITSASYRVVPFPAESPTHPGGTPAVVSNPWTAAPGNATSLYWHNNGTTDYTYTRGNNVWALEDRDGNNNTTGNPAFSTTTSAPLSFDFTPSFTVTPTQTTPVQNQQFNITNLFYWNNIIHDITYQYGFDEVSGNFQTSNQSRGGAGNDHVMADAQDGSGTNNANFSTPADGSSGRMQMFLWNGTPQRDGDVDNGIITHEYAHGISNRLTGGPALAGCLSNDEQMGEGWSDYYALMYTQDWANSNLNTGFNSPRPVGTYAFRQQPSGAGIRTKKYCTDFTINNLVYSNSSTQMTESHNRGEVWCAALWDMTWNIINQVGTINSNIYDANGGGGNTIALKLVTMGMKLQPCSPGFIDGRDAILQADQLLYGGAYSCAIIEAFRRRGMGAFASQGSSSNNQDQVPDFTTGSATLSLTQSVIQVPEGQNITYYNKVTTGSCAGISNFVLTDTLPSNVTYVSGGTYNAANRVVSFPVTLAAGQSQVYSFTVQVNNGAYFPTVTLFEDTVSTATVPATWTAVNNVAGVAANWVVSTDRSFSPNKSYYAQNLDVQSDERLTLVTPISLGANPPNLTFRHWYNTESTYDGGVLDISSDGGTTWTTNISSLILSGGYIATMDATTLLNGRRAWSGSSGNKFIKTKVNLASYANKSILLRFRFTSDVGTNAEGWYVDDIAIKNQAVVEMQSNLYNSSNVNVAISDTITVILPAVSSSFTFTPASDVNVTCGSAATPTTLLSNVVGTFTTPITLTYTSSIPGTTVSFGTNPLTPGNSTTVTLNNANTLAPGTDTVIVTGVAGAITQKDTILFVIQPGSAPVITTQPTNQTVCAGANATFTSASSTGGVSYQWQVSTNSGSSWSNVASGGTSASYTVNSTTSAQNNYQYRVIISTLCGTITSNAATLTVNTLPAISVSPASVSVCAGSSHTFSSTATGTNLTYQWQVSTNGGSSWSNVASGGTSATYQLTGITLGQNGYQYHVVVSGTCTPSATSSAATLTVSGAPSITTQPSNVTQCAGTNATFGVTASGSGLTYQWQVNTGGGFANVASGGTSASYTVNSITAAQNNYQYQVVVSGAGCGTPTTSSAATLTVNTLPAVTTQPTNQTVCAGATATFTAAATGPGVSYQWQVNTGGGFTNVASGGNAASYTTAATTAGQSGYQYQVVVSGTCTPNATSSAATLTVNTLPAITTQPTGQTVCVGASATFTAAATGTGITYQWQENTGGGFNNISGANGASYTINPTNAGQNGNLYQVVVSGTCSPSATSNSATLTLNAPTTPTFTQVPAICSGGSFSLPTTSTNTISGTWTPAINNSSSTLYTFTPSAGQCATSTTMTVTVNPLPIVNISANPGNVLFPGQSITMTASATPVATTYTWLANGVLLQNQNNNTLSISGNTPGSYSYSASITDINGCTSTSDQFVIDVRGLAFIYPNPNNGQFFISFEGAPFKDQPKLISLYDAKGSRVYSQYYTLASSLYQTLQIDVHHLSKGTYVLVLSDIVGNPIKIGRVVIE